MKSTDSKIIKAIEDLSGAPAVVYLAGVSTPAPVTQAGSHRGKTYYITGTGPHVIGPEAECEIDSAGAVMVRVDGELELYFTRATEAPETTPEEVALAIAKAKRWIEENGGMAELLDMM